MVTQRGAFHLRVGNAGTEADGLGILDDVPALEFVYSSKGDDVVQCRAIEVDLDHQVGSALHQACSRVIAQRLECLLQRRGIDDRHGFELQSEKASIMDFTSPSGYRMGHVAPFRM